MDFPVTTMLCFPQQAMRGFSKWGIPQCIGAIDGCHINIPQPQESPDAYLDRKGNYSVVFQGVVDHRGLFIDASIGNVGCDHDAHVLRCSNFMDAMDAGAFVPGNPTITIEGTLVPPLVLGDRAYPSRSWLMTPHKGSITAEDRRFNAAHSRTRMVVERAFGKLKNTWRCLRLRLPVTMQNVNCVIAACIAMHNVLVLGIDRDEHPDLGPHHAPLPYCKDPPEEIDAREKEAGENVRKALTAHLQRRSRSALS